MSLIQGYYSSSDNESENDGFRSTDPSIRHTENLLKPLDKKEVFAGQIQSIKIDSSTFDRDFKEKKGLGSKHVLNSKSKKLKKKRKSKGNPGDLDYLGPWATYDSGDEKLQETAQQAEPLSSEDEEADAVEIEEKAPTSQLISKKYESSGRQILDIPKNLNINITGKSGTHECFVPKRVLHTIDAHKKGINKIEFLPSTGHVFLSCGNDTEIKLWSFYDDFELIRVYNGHAQGITDICFSQDGTKFLSCSYDKKVHLWDTENGTVIKTLNLGSIPNTLKFNPNNENEFIVGLLNNNIEHYDFSTLNPNVPTQIYDHHLGSITSVSVIENGKRFMSCSSDKSIKMWDWGINIPVKIISNPAQPYIPVSVVHPDTNYIALQCMDDTVKVIQGHSNYKFNKKKVFKGHHVSGYKIQIDISPDGKILLSGDSKGNGYFWDWKSCRLVNKLKLSDKPINCIKFHPQESSKVLAGCSTGQIVCCD